LLKFPSIATKKSETEMGTSLFQGKKLKKIEKNQLLI